MTTDTTPPPPPPPAPPRRPAAGRRLTRRTDDRVCAGVASGLGAHFGIDPVLVRVAFVLLAVFGGSGLLIYLVLWLLVPEQDSGEVVADRANDWARDESRRLRASDRGWPFWLGIGLIALAAVNLVDHVVDGGVVLALVLIGLGVALFNADRSGDDPHDGGGGAVPPPPAPADTPVVGDATVDADDLTPPAPPAPPVDWGVAASPRPPRGRRERSILGRLTVGLAALAVGVATMLDQLSDQVDLAVADHLGLATAVVGVGLLVGAFVGRARWLIVVGVVLTPFLLGASLIGRIDIPVDAGIGERDVVVTQAAPALDEELFLGELTIDVADGGTVDRDVRARIAAGSLRVTVPADWTVVIDAEVRGGEIRVRDGASSFEEDGFRRELRRTLPGDPDLPTVRLDLEVVFGEILVTRR